METVTQPTEPESPRVLSERLKPEHESAYAEAADPRLKANIASAKPKFAGFPVGELVDLALTPPFNAVDAKTSADLFDLVKRADGENFRALTKLVK